MFLLHGYGVAVLMLCCCLLSPRFCLAKSTSLWQTTTTVATGAAAAAERPLPPFHLAFPVHDLQVAKNFYGKVLGLEEGRSSDRWQDYSLDGHQIVCHLVDSNYRGADFFNPVDGDEVPVPHFGLAMTLESFHAFAKRLREHQVQFIIEPHLRFKGAPGEQWTMFFKDPSGNNLEFKAMTTPENLFAKYNVVEESHQEQGGGGEGGQDERAQDL